ncbi:MBL fold metallo-hydrolase [Candidatus Poribacteria bacterium]|nr:MBL fold metallo-hydrolase [Candidatus Poribacteria bacterium]
MDNIYLRWWGCGAFDVRFNDINITFDPYLFNQNLAEIEPIYDYIFISHEHFDHCHPETLRKLCKGSRFKKLFVNAGCITPAQPIKEKYGDAAFERDLPITKHVPPDKVEILYPNLLDAAQGLSRSFNGTETLKIGNISIDTIESGENQSPNLPTNGYLISHLIQDISILHTGDLHEPYPALENLRGNVDILVHMKLGLGDGVSHRLVELVDLIEPRFMIPTHYRTDRKSDPIPVGHWPPNVTDENAFIESIREIVGNKTRILPFTAGIEYEVKMPEKEINWKWDWFNTWTIPPWRETNQTE